MKNDCNTFRFHCLFADILLAPCFTILSVSMMVLLRNRNIRVLRDERRHHINIRHKKVVAVLTWLCLGEMVASTTRLRVFLAGLRGGSDRRCELPVAGKFSKIVPTVCARSRSGTRSAPLLPPILPTLAVPDVIVVVAVG